MEGKCSLFVKIAFFSRFVYKGVHPSCIHSQNRPNDLKMKIMNRTLASFIHDEVVKYILCVMSLDGTSLFNTGKTIEAKVFMKGSVAQVYLGCVANIANLNASILRIQEVNILVTELLLSNMCPC
jgi:hypothetical protein